MIKSLWTAKTGLEAQQTKMDVIANNLANVSTNGFKKSRAVFQDLLYQNMRQAGGRNDMQNVLPAGLQIGSGVRPVATERIQTQGDRKSTRLNSSHPSNSYAVVCLKNKKTTPS